MRKFQLAVDFVMLLICFIGLMLKEPTINVNVVLWVIIATGAHYELYLKEKEEK